MQSQYEKLLRKFQCSEIECKVLEHELSELKTLINFMRWKISHLEHERDRESHNSGRYAWRYHLLLGKYQQLRQKLNETTNESLPSQRPETP